MRQRLREAKKALKNGVSVMAFMEIKIALDEILHTKYYVRMEKKLREQGWGADKLVNLVKH